MRLRLGVVGERISYTLSPRIFAWASAATGVPLDYTIFQLSASEFDKLVRSQEGWDGLNVTVPHKMRAAELCEELDGEAQATGSVNTLQVKGGRLIGYNTDVFGFGFVLQQHQRKIENASRALIIGNGGAARAVVVAMSRQVPQIEITLAVRDPHKAERSRLEPSAGGHKVIVAPLDLAGEDLSKYDFIVQATPVGSAILPGMPLPRLSGLRPETLVMDLIYAPRLTGFLAAAQEQGCEIENGLTMLIAQASRSFEVWTDQPFPLARALRELKPQLESL